MENMDTYQCLEFEANRFTRDAENRREEASRLIDPAHSIRYLLDAARLQHAGELLINIRARLIQLTAGKPIDVEEIQRIVVAQADLALRNGNHRMTHESPVELLVKDAQLRGRHEAAKVARNLVGEQ